MKVFTKNSNSPKASATKAKDKAPFFGVQAKLRIGKADDPYERQADSVAEKVVANNEKQASYDQPNANFFTGANSATIQRKPFVTGKSTIAKSITPGITLQAQNEEETQTKLQRAQEEEAQTKVQLMPFEDVQKAEDEEAQTKVQLMPFEDVQAKMATPEMPKVDIAQKVQSKKGSGNAMPEETQTAMESGFGADFSGVNIHTDSESAGMNKDLGAKAFTSGNDIFFNEGQFKPETKEGQTLLAHELTHTIQQGASGANETVTPEDPNADPSKAAGGEVAQGAGGATANGEGETTNSETPSEGEAVEGEIPVEEVPETPAEGEEVAAEGEAAEGEGEGDGGPTTPRSPEEDPNFQQMEGRVETTSGDQQAHEEPAAAAGSAQGAAASPANERGSMAQAGQVDAMDEAEPEEFSAEAFKAQLMERINSMQLPSNPDEADNFDDNNNIDEVNEAATQDASSAQAEAAGPVQTTTAAEPNEDAVPEREVTPLPEPPVGEAPPSVNPAAAMPPRRGNSEVNQPLQDNMSEVDQQMAENEITDEQLEKSNEPKFMAGLEAKDQAKEHTENAPNAMRQQEQGILANAQVNADTQAQTGLTGMHQDRATALNDVNMQQGQTGETDTAERTRIADEINVIYENAKADVEQILSDLDTTVTDKFTKGADRAKALFESYVERKMDAYKDRRYSGLTGAGRWLVDKFAGMPEEVNEFFTEGRQVYIDHMDVVITEISNIVAAELTRAKDRVNQGKQEVQDYVTSLPENLQQIGSDAADEISSKFDELEESVNAKQEELIDNLANAYVESLEAVDARIEEMQAENRGLIDMALGAIMGIIQTIIDIKNMLTELLMGAIGAIMTIISDPIGFLSNLFGGIKQGFEQFGSNILTHLQTALIQWLTGALGPVGITMPDDLFSLQGIFSLVAQILGLTWDYIRQKAVQHLGEPVVVALETGFEIFQVIRTGGIDGLWEYLKEQFNDLKETVIDAIKEMVITTVIEAGIKWVLGLLNPASAFVKACMMIIDVVRFFIERGSQIIELVRAFIEGVNAVASGNVTAVANAIENALARALPVIIGFLASLLGISGLARKVTKLIGKIRKRVDKAVEKLIKKAKAAGRKLLARMGIGRNPDGSPQEGQEGGDGELGHTVNFNDGEENHRLWVDETGPRAVLKVASEPKTVEEKVAEWRAELAKPEWNHAGKAAKKQRINSHLANVVSKLGIIEQNISQAESNERQGDPVPENVDNTIEQNETTVSQSLRELFKEFKETQDLNVLYAEEINQSHTAAKPTVVETVQTINDAQENNSEIRSFNGLTGKIKQTADADGLFTDPINNNKPYGAAVRQQIDQVGQAELGAEKWNDKKDRLISKMTPGTDVHNALKNQILDGSQSSLANDAIKNKVKSTADHNKFKPVNIVGRVLPNGDKEITYQYAEGAQRFTTIIGVGNYPKQIRGENLEIHDLGRGTTHDSTGKVTGEGQDSSHGIANELMGTGYNANVDFEVGGAIQRIKVSLNLVAASANFNQVIMRDVERAIVSYVKDNQADSFNMTVNIEYAREDDRMELNDLLERIKTMFNQETSEQLQGEDLQDVSNRIYEKLTNTVQPRILDVDYYVRLKKNNANMAVAPFIGNTGPDLEYGV